MMTDTIKDDEAYRIVEEMGLGLTFRSCSCGQLPCARLRPLRDALKAARDTARDRCVVVMEQMRDRWESKRNGLEPLSKMRNRYDAAFCAANEIITALEALTLEGEREKEKPVDVCVVCKSEPVCPEEGFDTCTYCARRI